MVGHGGSSAGSYLADPTSPIPSHCASIVVTSTLRVNDIPLGSYEYLMRLIVPHGALVLVHPWALCHYASCTEWVGLYEINEWIKPIEKLIEIDPNCHIHAICLKAFVILGAVTIQYNLDLEKGVNCTNLHELIEIIWKKHRFQTVTNILTNHIAHIYSI